jgi:hypothetical protein
VAAEFKRLEELVPASFQKRLLLAAGSPLEPVQTESLRAFAGLLGSAAPLAEAGEPIADLRAGFDPGPRQLRQVRELEDHAQRLLRGADSARHSFFLGQTTLMKTLESRGQRFRMARVATRSPETFAEETRHHDGVAPDEWVSSEYAKVRWLYAQLGLADRTEIEYYNGGHIINAQATFDFLHRHLNWPKP